MKSKQKNKKGVAYGKDMERFGYTVLQKPLER